MLNSMFREIQNRLGSEYGLFREFNPQPYKNEELRQYYKNLGVLYVNNGDLGNLPDGAMMRISYTLELFMRVEESYNNSDPVVLPLDELATGTTGVIMSSTNNVQAKFILDTGVPTSDGAIIFAGECNYVRFEVPIAVTFVNGIALADNNHIVLTINGIEYPALKSVISFTEAPQVELETATFINGDNTVSPNLPAMQNESVIVSSGWNAQVSKLFRPGDEADKAIRRLALASAASQGTCTLRYSNDGSEDNETIRKVIIHDVIFANELGQPAYLTFKMSTAMRY